VLIIVRTWNFILPPPQPPRPRAPSTAASLAEQMKSGGGGLRGVSPSLLRALDEDPRSIMRRRSSLVVDDLPPEARAALRHRLEDSIVTEDGEREEDEGEDEEGEEPNGVRRGGAVGGVDAPKSPVAAAKKPPPAAPQYQEPDADSLLDSFGF
jgi:hypothetical protein